MVLVAGRIWCFLTLSFILQSFQYYGTCTQDQTSPRPNTLGDDADDIQRQLDNEARDRNQFGKTKTIWVLNFPTHFTRPRKMAARKNRNNFSVKKRYAKSLISGPSRLGTDCPPFWDYEGQTGWGKTYPECLGRSQSPVNLPTRGLVPAHAGRKLRFCNYDAEPTAIKLIRDDERIYLQGEWREGTRPLVHGGAAHSRKYLFHSLTLHSPSEHAVGGFLYPLESQLLFFSAEYEDLAEALNASQSDPLAMLGIASLYKYASHTQPGLMTMISAALRLDTSNQTLPALPLEHFSPTFSQYACYQGSLPTPPCSEAVLWLVRARTLPVTREVVEAAHGILGTGGAPVRFRCRAVQPLNDRRVFLFKKG